MIILINNIMFFASLKSILSKTEFGSFLGQPKLSPRVS